MQRDKLEINFIHSAKTWQLQQWQCPLSQRRGNISKIQNQCGSEGAKEREAYKMKHFSQLSISKIQSIFQPGNTEKETALREKHVKF